MAATNPHPDPPVLPLTEIAARWARRPDARTVYAAVLEARQYGLTAVRVADVLGLTRQDVSMQYWQPFHTGGRPVADPPVGFDPEVDVPSRLAAVVDARAVQPSHRQVFLSILEHRIRTGDSMQAIADQLGRKREQVYRDYWTPFSVEGARRLGLAQRAQEETG